MRTLGNVAITSELAVRKFLNFFSEYRQHGVSALLDSSATSVELHMQKIVAVVCSATRYSVFDPHLIGNNSH